MHILFFQIIRILSIRTRVDLAILTSSKKQHFTVAET